MKRDGGGDSSPGERGAGGIQVVGEEGAESGIPKVAGSGEIRKSTQHCTIFCNQKSTKRREPTIIAQEPGLKGTGSRRFKRPCSLPHKWGPVREYSSKQLGFETVT